MNKLYILIALIHRGKYQVSASECVGPNASPNWYGSVGYPPYFTRDTPEKCPQKFALSRCEQSAVMKDGNSFFATNDNGQEVCTPNADCFPTKQNCNDTLTCSDLVDLKEELSNGGHNLVCRHEKTFWQGYVGEVACQKEGNCLDPGVKLTQRQLQPYGWKSAEAFSASFREMGIPIGKTFSSPFSRCAMHAELFSEIPNEDRLELLYMGGWKEVIKLNNITEATKSNAIKWQAYNLRNFAGKTPLPGKNNIMVTHGFNIKLAFGTAVDEGYCMVLKPKIDGPSLAESIGSLTVANRVFTFDNDSFPVDAISRMSPESATHMQTCDDVRTDHINNPSDNLLTSYDINNDMKITEDEFMLAHGSLSNSKDAFNFIRSIFVQPESLGKITSSTSVIHLGQFFHINWGWREFSESGGGISYPWRVILENTIGSGGATSDERVLMFNRANAILLHLLVALKDVQTFPSIKEMKGKLMECSDVSKKAAISDLEASSLTNCGATTHLAESGGASYFSIGSGDSGAAALHDESVFGTPLAYPAEWKPDTSVYGSKTLIVASCLVSQGSLTFSELMKSMGCTTLPYDDHQSLATTPNQIETTLSWVFGALFVLTLAGLAYVLMVYTPKKIHESKTSLDVTTTDLKDPNL